MSKICLVVFMVLVQKISVFCHKSQTLLNLLTNGGLEIVLFFWHCEIFNGEINNSLKPIVGN